MQLLPGLLMLALLVLPLGAASLFWAHQPALDLETVLVWFAGWGWWSPAAFFALRTAMVALGLPTWMLTLAGGALFGIVAGTLYATVSTLIGAVIAFWWARALGRHWQIALPRRLQGWWHHLEANLSTRGFWLVLSARCNPLLPFGLLNALLGLSQVSLRNYVLGTLLGIVPGTAIYTWLGTSGREALALGDMAQLWPAVLALAIVSLLPLWLLKAGNATAASADR